MSRLASISARTKAIAAIAAAALVIGGLWWRFTGPNHDSLPAHEAPSLHPVTQASHQVAAPANTLVEFPQESWNAAGIELHAAAQGKLVQSVQLTGKITLNEDRVTHLFPLVDGRVDEVKVQFGQHVEAGELLAIVQSKEVGQAMLQLFQDRLQLEFAVTKDRWTQEVTSNTLALIELLRADAKIDDIETKLRNRPVGEHRDKLLTAYVSHYKSRLQYDRLLPLSRDGSVAGKQLLEAESEQNTSRATLQSLIEQISQDATQAAIVSAQTIKELKTRIAVDETNLEILGFKKEDLANIDPVKQGETLAHYPVRAPFAGTIIAKDVTLLERVGPDSQLLSIADLSTVWVTADVFEEQLPLLDQLNGKTIKVRSSAWPGRTFEATVFYTGDIIHESSRTVSLRAVAKNPDALLKPGMFVSVEFPDVEQNEMLQVPLSAVQDHEGKSFVFVHIGGNQFERREVELARRNSDHVEVVSGLKPGDMVVTKGGFALKTQMLAELLAE
ncbi:Cobalt-zinc-cadmium resistance protein CzcB [Anatilimnocola aggregata]|uniref:Cobalt-zinc-cadmium resistance protein CzcB n=1 Tax=Anatilimnocola aggregata TaxID=2528021 RepID=A0A517YJ10_9BACT|nr:efflux RND transporter periplasmic adaptor subunit [Anatilimnocola aggregata]QDU30202.1 Cobalt-zinc-cadmium resistance protein CzcB [Anatilimnocola aggregata]